MTWSEDTLNYDSQKRTLADYIFTTRTTLLTGPSDLNQTIKTSAESRTRGEIIY